MKWALSSPSPDRSGNRGTDRVSQLLESTQLASGRAQSGVAVWPQSPCSKPLGLVSKNLQKVQALIPNFHAPTSQSLHVPAPCTLLPTTGGLHYSLALREHSPTALLFIAACSQRKHHCLKYRLQQHTVCLSAQQKPVIMYSRAMPRFRFLPTTLYVRDPGSRLHHVLPKTESPAPGTK